jgi:hypothetical protein
VKGSRLYIPRYGHPDYDPIRPKPLSISKPAASTSISTPPALASEAPSTPDPNEYAIASSSEDDSPPPISTGRRVIVNTPSLLPASLFGPAPAPRSGNVASGSKLPIETELSPLRIIEGIQVNTPGVQVAPLFSGPPPALPSSEDNVSGGETESEPLIETEVTPPRMINGRQINTPGAQVAPLFSGPPSTLPSDGAVSDSEAERKPPAESETESKAPTETFSDAGELEAVSLATTPEPSPLRPLRTFRPIEAEVEARAAIRSHSKCRPEHRCEHPANASPNHPDSIFQRFK